MSQDSSAVPSASSDDDATDRVDSLTYVCRGVAEGTNAVRVPAEDVAVAPDRGRCLPQ
ncbi:hypothetical protein HRW23_11300 [Streptomyces lunaelactis]|uniref:hypothetical protein n=1 Tax=Streptomyces lunaelactis TaxID=1535768 RepID=UPI001585159A|nr:hypothetical protein [Streptomyces lunaelactis]NUK00944.1 hypothetical protein [Streptomyces lunaelactis]NUK13764.1 hypothetical protein [Streptomyces lunaelactis]NUK21595.1 hypothetical protein [Streptomyces lunaelactis]NUK51017.1 hypothetical protein [Streptomyces lunaelactis]NUK62743.1 hypothetical protein [Streptomyces lunaelactis]